MKVILIVFIMLMFISLAIFVYYRYLVRYRLFKDSEYIARFIKNNINFNKNNVNNLILSACSNVSNITRNIFCSDSSSIMIKKNDIEFIRQFINSLGKGDVDYEINNIKYYETVFNEYKNTAHEHLKNNGLMYLKLIIGIGLAVVIIII